jgi:hypothetical protein
LQAAADPLELLADPEDAVVQVHVRRRAAVLSPHARRQCRDRGLDRDNLCDSAGLRQFVMAHHYAEAHDAQMRFAIPHRSTLRVLTLTGFDQLLSIYPSLRAAVSAAPALDTDAASG